jgi:cytochrome c biogenesis factor
MGARESGRPPDAGHPLRRGYASRPLKQTDRNIVLINLALLPAGAVLFLAMNDVAVVTKVVLATVLGSAMAMLLRVWRRGSWLAVTHLPAKPRRTAG